MNFGLVNTRTNKTITTDKHTGEQEMKSGEKRKGGGEILKTNKRVERLQDVSRIYGQ